jgi:RNA polymerase sigma-70 factor (ECF subfamily)
MAADRPVNTGRFEAFDDERLMAQVAGGDRSAFDALAQRHLGRALRTARRLLTNQSDAEEIVQEAMLRVWMHARRWQPERARFTTWLYQIVTNLAIDRLRKPTMAPLEAAGDPADPAPHIGVELERRERMDLIGRKIDEMPGRQKAVLTLCYYEGLTCREAADVMDMSVAAVEALLLRSRRALKQKLEGYEV